MEARIEEERGVVEAGRDQGGGISSRVVRAAEKGQGLDTCGQSQSTADQSQILKSIFISNL